MSLTLLNCFSLHVDEGKFDHVVSTEAHRTLQQNKRFDSCVYSCFTTEQRISRLTDLEPHCAQMTTTKSLNYIINFKVTGQLKKSIRTCVDSVAPE